MVEEELESVVRRSDELRAGHDRSAGHLGATEQLTKGVVEGGEARWWPEQPEPAGGPRRQAALGEQSVHVGFDLIGDLPAPRFPAGRFVVAPNDGGAGGAVRDPYAGGRWPHRRQEYPHRGIGREKPPG